MKNRAIRSVFTDFLTKIEGVYSNQELESIAYLVFEKILKVQKIDIISNIAFDLDEENEKILDSIVQRINQHEPIQYILGEVDFYSCKLKVNSSVLIPRPETEELVDLILKENKTKSHQTIVDLCTGSGCIAIPLAKHLIPSHVHAIDISKSALEVASENAKQNGVHVDFQIMDILKVNQLPITNIDIIVSNPPYVTEGEKKYMQKNVLDYEPAIAIFVPNEDPLLFYKKVIQLAEMSLSSGGKLYMEINEWFGEEIKNLFVGKGFHSIEIIVDLNNKDRFVKAMV